MNIASLVIEQASHYLEHRDSRTLTNPDPSCTFCNPKRISKGPAFARFWDWVQEVYPAVLDYSGATQTAFDTLTKWKKENRSLHIIHQEIRRLILTLAFQGDIEDSEGDFTYYLSTILTLTEVFTNEKDPVDLYIQVKQRAIERLRKGNPDLTTTEFFETLKAKTPRGKGKALSTTPIITSPVLKNLKDNPWETPKGSPSIRPISPLKNLGFSLHIQPTLSGISTPNWSNPPTRSPTPERSNSNSSTSSSDSETVSESETEEEENTPPRHLRHIIESRIPTLTDITTMAEKMIVKPSKYYG